MQSKTISELETQLKEIQAAKRELVISMKYEAVGDCRKRKLRFLKKY